MTSRAASIGVGVLALLILATVTVITRDKQTFGLTAAFIGVGLAAFGAARLKRTD